MNRINRPPDPSLDLVLERVVDVPPERVWKAISTKSPVESSCCNCSNPPVIEMVCSFARARCPPSAITAAVIDPNRFTRGERWLTLDWGK